MDKVNVARPKHCFLECLARAESNCVLHHWKHAAMSENFECSAGVQ